MLKHRLRVQLVSALYLNRIDGRARLGTMGGCGNGHMYWTFWAESLPLSWQALPRGSVRRMI